MIRGRRRHNIPVRTLPSLAAPAGMDAPPSTPRTIRLEAAALRSLVDGVEIIGQLPACRGVMRHRLRILPSSGAPIAANLNCAPDGVWVSIETPSLPQPLADRLAEAAMLRLRAADLPILRQHVLAQAG